MNKITQSDTTCLNGAKPTLSNGFTHGILAFSFLTGNP